MIALRFRKLPKVSENSLRYNTSLDNIFLNIDLHVRYRAQHQMSDVKFDGQIELVPITLLWVYLPHSLDIKFASLEMAGKLNVSLLLYLVGYTILID